MCYCNSYKRFNKKKRVIGWNRFVSETLKEAKCILWSWLWFGGPMTDRFYNDMRDSRWVFKSRLQWYQRHEEQIKMDLSASHHFKRDFRNF